MRNPRRRAPEVPYVERLTPGDERAQEVWLKNRTRKAALLGLDLKPEQHVVAPTFVVNTALPPEVVEVVDEDGPSELEAGEAA